MRTRPPARRPRTTEQGESRPSQHPTSKDSSDSAISFKLTHYPVIQFTADGRRVHQILLNLLSNAINFSSPGGSIELDARLQDGEVRLSVSDSGIGIAADQLRL